MASKEVFITIILLIILINPISAQGCAEEGYMGEFQQNSTVQITETCPTCTFININVKNTTSDIIILNQSMSLSNGVFTFNVSGGNHTELGTYWVEGYSNLDTPIKACYVITNIKRETTTSESVLYIFLLVLSLFVFLFCLMGAVSLPFSNKRNALGRVIDVSWTKYFKVGFMFITYLILVWIMNLAISVTDNLVSLTQFSGFFTMMFNILSKMAYPIFVVMFIFMFVLIIKDLKLNKLLQRGLNPR